MMMWPVTQTDRSDARNAAGPAISSDDRVGETMRCTGMVAPQVLFWHTSGTQSVPTNDSFSRIPSDDVPDSMMEHWPAFCEKKGTTGRVESGRPAVQKS